jgi:hypothetical protein
VENLSPFHFAVYLNDLESFLGTGNLKGLESISRDIEKQFDIYLNLFTLLYADDTFLMAESPQELQNLLDSFDDYCSVWKLKVNAEKKQNYDLYKWAITTKFEVFITRVRTGSG